MGRQPRTGWRNGKGPGMIRSFLRTLHKDADKAACKSGSIRGTGFAFEMGFPRTVDTCLDPDSMWGITGRKSLPLIYNPLTKSHFRPNRASLCFCWRHSVLPSSVEVWQRDFDALPLMSYRVQIKPAPCHPLPHTQHPDLGRLGAFSLSPTLASSSFPNRSSWQPKVDAPRVSYQPH